MDPTRQAHFQTQDQGNGWTGGKIKGMGKSQTQHHPQKPCPPRHRQPRTHADLIEGWRTSCPRLPVWEECTDQGFVRRRGGLVELTERGRSFLAGR